MKLKSILYSVLFVFGFAAIFSACTKPDDNNNNNPQVNELEGLKLAKQINNDDYLIDFYTKTGKFYLGYNEIYFQVKNNDGSLVTDLTAEWRPVMSMSSMSHSCPTSNITKKQGAASTFGGHIVFQMPSDSEGDWDLNFTFHISGASYEQLIRLDVLPTAFKTLQTFVASDSLTYIVAMDEPRNPKVGVNDMSAVIYKIEESGAEMSFVPVINYKLKIDPRMPTMGNHSSPNNEDLKPSSASSKYSGKLNLTMTGYWKISLMLENASSEIIQGEEVNPDNESSSIYFEVEI